jgi:hypothetical protein
LIVGVDGVLTGAGMMAALDAVTRLKANAAPSASVRIIDCFPYFSNQTRPPRRFIIGVAGTYPANMTNTMTEGCTSVHVHGRGALQKARAT